MFNTGFSNECGNEWQSVARDFLEEGVHYEEKYGRNNKENKIWFERWYEANNELKASKFGRNTEEEWQESWEEKFIDSERKKPIYKSCKKTNKKFNSKIQRFESWYEIYRGKLKNINFIYH